MVGAKLGGKMPLWDAVKIPYLQKVHLRYNVRTYVALAAGVTNKYIISQNSVYDPDITAVGS